MRGLRGIDRTLLGLILLALLAGIAVLYAASSQIAALEGASGGRYLLRRMIQIGLGLACLSLAASAEPQWIRRLAWPAAVTSGVLLVWVLGSEMIKGTRGWLFLGPFTLQPVDVARVGLLVFMADRLAARDDEEGWRRFVLPGGALLLAVGFVALQPDFGSALALGLSGACVLVAARLPWRWLGATALLAALVVSGAYLGSDRVRERVDLTLHFDATEQTDENYQLRQSLIGIGAGGGLGQGAGRNRQRIFLPDHHTDFIFAIVGEEYGFVGTTLLVLLLTALSLRLLRIARRLVDPFGRYLAAGVGGMLFVYTALNVLVALGLFPLTGVPLPFISHGGSALVMNLVALGLVLGVAREGAETTTRPRRVRATVERGIEDLFGRSGGR